jgi:hypothetical protein
LRDKLNAYMAFVESGGLIETYPDAAGRAVVINVVGKYDLSGSASDFYDNAAATIAAAGLSLHFEKFVDPEGLE